MAARSMDVAAELRAASAALGADDAAGALATMLGVWRAIPAAALGAAIDLVGARAARRVHAPGGVDNADREATWQAAARTGDPVVRHALIATITDVRDVDAQVARARALVAFRDPRVARKLVAMIAEHRWPNLRVAAFWLPMFDLLIECGDPDVRYGFARVSWGERLGRISNQQRAAFYTRIGKVGERLAARYPSPPPELAPELAELVAAIAARAAAPAATADRDARVDRDLLRAVFASPADDGPRAIYADWLQERGDPRGELIALQLAADWKSEAWLAGPAPKRIEHLLEQHRRRWLEPIGESLASSKFARGFLASAELSRVKPRAHAMWSTVTSITGGIPATDAYPMPVLTGAYDLPSEAVVALDKLETPPPLTHLGWRTDTIDWTPANGHGPKSRAAIAAFARLIPGLTTLRFLRLQSPGWDAMLPAQLGWSWRGTSIRTLRITTGITQLAAWLDAIAGTQLDELELSNEASAWRTIIARDRLAITGGFRRPQFAAELETIANAIERQPAGRLTEFAFATPREAWTLANRRRMAAALAVHPRMIVKITNYTPPR